jgi:hypothetical protein
MSHLELIAENITRQSDINHTRFQNDVASVLRNGGKSNFTKETLLDANLEIEKLLASGDLLFSPELLASGESHS